MLCSEVSSDKRLLPLSILLPKQLWKNFLEKSRQIYYDAEGFDLIRKAGVSQQHGGVESSCK